MMDVEKLIRKGKSFSNKRESIEDELIQDLTDALSTLQAENEKLRAELERMKKIMRDNGIMTIPPKYPGWPTEWNIPKPRGKKKED